MATSGSFNYSINGTLIIKNALIDAGILRDDQTVESDMETFALYRLNLLLKSLQSVGLHLWRTKDTTLLLESGKSDYTLGEGGDRYAETIHETTLTSGVSSGGQNLTIESNANMNLNDVIGIELDDGTVDWTTIDAVSTSTLATVASGLSSAASSGNKVYSYTSVAPQPLKIHEGYVVQKDSPNNQTPVNIISNNEYMYLNNKTTSSGYPNQIQFRPEISTSELRVWPVPDNNTTKLVMTVELPLEDIDAVADDLAMPSYWFEAIHTAMVYQLGKSYAAPRDSVRMFKKDAEEAKEEAKAFGVENTYIQIVPEGYNYNV